MIGKQTKGRGFRGALNYVLGKEGAQLIGGNMLGENSKELAAEFAETRKLRPNVKRAVYHASLSLSPGESLTDNEWRQVSTDYMNKMGFGNSQFVVVKHTDTHHSHVHIIASRIALDGKVVSDSKDYQRSEEVLRGFEKHYALYRVSPSREVRQQSMSRGETQTHSPTKLRLQTLIDESTFDHPSMKEFFSRLAASKVEAIPNIAKTGHVSGISFRIDGEVIKGSDLGKSYSWRGLQKAKGIKYERHDTIRILERNRTEARRNSGLETLSRNDGRSEANGDGKRGSRDRKTRSGYESSQSGNGHTKGKHGGSYRISEKFRTDRGHSDFRVQDESRGSHRVSQGNNPKPSPEALDSHDNRSSSRVGNSRERILRMAKSILESKGGGGPNNHRSQPLSKPESSESSILKILDRALEPYDNEREKERHERELERLMHRKKGPEIDR